MRWGVGRWGRWLIASAAFHALLATAAWRVGVPVPAAARRHLALHVLPALAAPSTGATPMPEPALAPTPPVRPYLRPPAVDLDPATLMPGPFPHDSEAMRALRARPVLPAPEQPAAALHGVDPVPLLPREPPPPILD